VPGPLLPACQRYFPDQPVVIEQEGAFTLMAAASEPLENR